MASDAFNPVTSAPASASAGSQESILTLAWRQKMLIALIVLLALAAGAVYLAVVPRTYLTTATFTVTRSAPGQKDEGQATPQDTLGFLNTQVEVVRSTPVLIGALGRSDDPLNDLNFFATARNPIQLLKRELQVTVVKDTEIISVALRAADTKEAEKIVDGVVQSYIDFRGRLRQTTAGALYESMLKERSAAETERQEKATKRSQISIDGSSGNVTMLQLTDLSNALTRSRQEASNAKVVFDETLRDLGWDPDNYDENALLSGPTISSQNIDRVQANIFALGQRLQDAKRRYLPNHPAVRSIENDLREMQVGLAAAQRAGWKAALKREESTKTAFDQQQKMALETNSQAAQAAALDNEIRRIDTRLSEIDARMRSLAGEAAAPVITAQVVDNAMTDEEGSKSPSTTKTLGLALAAGLGLGTLLGLIREWTDPRLRSTEAITSTLGLPVIGTLPRLAGQRTPEMVGWITHLEADSEAADAYRSVRTSLLFGGVNGQEPRTILVTSPAARDGRSSLASNLAISLAQTGKRVIIVDATSREPVLHRVFDVNDEPGFSGVLSGGESLESAIRRTAIEHLDVLPAGPRLRKSSEVLNSPKLAEVIGYLTDRYDHVIFDGPPVSGGADARIIAAAVDQTVLIVRGDRVNRQLVLATRDGLLSVGAQIAGVVVSSHAAGAASGFAYGGAPVRGRGVGLQKTGDESTENTYVASKDR